MRDCLIIRHAMRRALKLLDSTVGKKLLMALSGFALLGFVFFHMLGNLKIYQGADKYDAYAEFLEVMGAPILGSHQALWLARLALLIAVAVHIRCAASLTRLSRGARPVNYRKDNDLAFSYASRTMRWGGLIVLAFIVYHLLHLTLGVVHMPADDEHSVYARVVFGFRQWPIALAYVFAMIPLSLHLYHGVWSMTQTLGIETPWVVRCRRPVAAGFAIIVATGNISIPLAVLTGLVR
ncbi:MAG: succinate dehydrogenase cytochrome b subunit [Acidobacteriota bacterium]|nr:succinate dehydrogenase cytochrome b subunit [Acidobacteriota bacterium]